MEPTDQLVMPILVDVAGQTHTSVIDTVASEVFRAVRRLDAIGHPDLQDWLQAGMRKTTRKVKPTLFQRSTHEAAYAITMSDRVYVGGLKTYEQFTKFERRAQVSGWDLKDLPDVTHTPEPDCELIIAVRSDLSTGKAAAAAAHVATLCALDTQFRWALAHPAFRIQLIETIDEARSYFPIHDAGHTEVKPGTITAALVSI